MTKLKVFIFAADEPIGFGIVSYLLDTKKFKEIDTVYAGILDDSKSDQLKELGAEVVKYERHSLENTKESLKKSEIAILILHSIDNIYSTADLMMKEVAEAKVPYSILITQSNTKNSPPNSPLRKFLSLEEIFKGLNFKGVIIRYGFLIDNLLHTSKSIKNENKLKLSLGNGIITPLSKNEVSFAVANYIAKYHNDDKTISKIETVLLTGDKDYYGGGIAQAISKSIDQDIEYVNISSDKMDKLLEDQGLSQQHRQYTLDLYELAKDNNFKYITNDYERITGEKPKGVKQFIKDNDNSFKPKI